MEKGRQTRVTIPLAGIRPQLKATEREWRRNLDQLFSRAYFVLGEEGARFEREFAAHEGAAWAIAVGSGTAALELCLRSARIASDKPEVILPALTSPFSAQAVLAAGLLPRFADVDPETLLLDPDDAAGRATARTGAFLPVHLYGQPCDLTRLCAAARTLGAIVVQDACQAHGARFRGRPLAHYSRWVAYSLYPTKNLGCLGDGGAVATDSRVVADRLRLLRDGGRLGDQRSRIKAVHSRLDEIQACFLRAFLPMLDQWNARRAKLAALYDEALAGCDAVRLVRRGPESVNHLYVVRVRNRDRLRSVLAGHGILTGVHYPQPLHLHPAFRDSGAKRGAFPRAEKACHEIVSLPLWPHLPDSQVLRIASLLRRSVSARHPS
jgi:dTDP-3-amino-3,4,6-trideoxy-alpha-D-glucose transaminase